MHDHPDARPEAILLASCPDQRGLVAQLSGFIHDCGGNIVALDQHGEGEGGDFSMRLVWTLDGFALDREALHQAMAGFARRFDMDWKLRYSDRCPDIAVFVSREAHCLYDLLHCQQLGELPGSIALVVSNHPDLGAVAGHFDVPFEYIPVDPSDKSIAEKRQRDLLAQYDIDLVVLARYMQILSPPFAADWRNRMINIHHSFLPAFAGANPYRQAKERGVKIIGATAHYVTAELDEGPIIEQNVTRVSHRDTVGDLRRKGRDLERQVLTRAVTLHLERRIIVAHNRTIIFA